jgi:hypothetical protein
MTRPLALRSEDPPADATVIVRGGVLRPDAVRRSAGRSFDLHGMYGISVEGVLGRSVHDACRTSDRLSGYRQIRLSTFRRVRAGGFAILATFDAPHFTIVLPDVSEITIVRLGRCFDEPIANPAGGSQR